MEQKATAVDKQKFYDWITDALYPHKVMTAYRYQKRLQQRNTYRLPHGRQCNPE